MPDDPLSPPHSTNFVREYTHEDYQPALFLSAQGNRSHGLQEIYFTQDLAAGPID